MQRTKGGKYVLAASIVIVTFLIYLPALRDQFVNWDDDRYIFQNLHIRSLGAEFFRWAFLDFYASNWHPLTWFSHALDYALWGLDPLGHHLTSILLHAVNTGLVVVLALKLLEIARGGAQQSSSLSFLNDRTVLIAAGATGLLFGLHPLHVESVAWVMERKDLLCALFFLLSIIAYAHTVRRIGGSAESRGQGAESKRLTLGALVPALCLFVLALMSKPMAVTLPVVLLILDWYPFGRIRSGKTLWSAGIEKLPFFVLSLASSVLTILAQRSGGALSPLDVVPLSTRLLVAARSLAAYLGKMLLPLDLLPFYPYPRDASLLSLEYALSIGLVFGITAACVALAGKQKGWLSAWGYYVVTLVPVLGIVQVGGQSMADRYTYLPSLGPFLAAGSMAAWSAAKMREARGVNEYRFSAVVALIVFLPLSFLTVQQVRVWQDSISLWDRVLAKEPDANIAAVNRGIAYMERGRLDKALEDLNRVISTRPDQKAFYHRALLFTKLNLVPQAISDYRSAIAVDPSFYDAYNNRGVLYERTGQYDKAFADYTAAISLRPSYFQAYLNRGRIFERQGQPDKALADFDRAIELGPGNPDAYYNRGLLSLDRLGQPDRALGDFDRAITLNPRDRDAYYHRGRALSSMGRFTEAVADFDRAIALDPSYSQAYRDRGWVLQKAGQLDKSARDLNIWKDHSTKNQHAR